MPEAGNNRTVGAREGIAAALARAGAGCGGRMIGSGDLKPRMARLDIPEKPRISRRGPEHRVKVQFRRRATFGPRVLKTLPCRAAPPFIRRVAR
jgi:hypothetical protein